MTRICLALLAFLLVINPARAADEPDLKPEIILSTNHLVAGQKFQASVVLNIPSPWHINANPAGQDLIPTELTLPAPMTRVVYPTGKQVTVSWADTPVPLYEGRTVLIAEGVAPAHAGKMEVKGELRFQACNDSTCLPPRSIPIVISAEVTGTAPAQATTSTAPPTGKTDETNSIASSVREKGWIFVLIVLFFGGLALNLTPCVYPMIAITVSYFGGQGERKPGAAFAHAFTYFLGIVITYSTLGLVAAMTGGLFGALLQSPWVLIGIAVLLVALALSMFGVYEIQPPQALLQRATGLSSKAGFVGVFFLGAAVGIIAAPCLAPILVALLAYVGQRGDPLVGFLLFLTLAAGLGLPYVVLGTFSGLLSRLPKSGMWMVWVKRVMGVLLIAVAVFLTRPLWPERGGGWPVYSTAAVKQAAAKHKPVIIDFSATWCGPCREMEHTTFRDPRVIEKGREFMLLKADVTRNEEPAVQRLMEEFKIRGVPTLVFIGADGHERPELRQTKYTSADELLKLMSETQLPAKTTTPATAAPDMPAKLMQPF
jgi:thioredoxin:protein disulfide reductase